MAPEHTKGPWRLGVGMRSGYILAMTPTGETRLAELYYGPRELAENRANGQLMASAPDLLAVCERIMAKDGVAALREQLRAAVAKARGE